MQSYRVDFTMNQGHEMTLDREGGIYRSELDEIEIQMLQSERIPFLLPVDWFELDGKLIFRYKLSGMKMLLHRLQQQKLTMEQYYSLILAVTDALFECKHYMLRPEGCLLDEQFIFFGHHLHDIRLAYVPMKGDAADQAVGTGDLLSLIVRFTSYIDQIDGEGLKQVLHHLTGTRWPLAELRATLLKLIGEPPSVQHNGAVQTVHRQQAQHFRQEHEYQQSQNSKKAQESQQSQRSRLADESQQTQQARQVQEESQQAQHSRHSFQSVHTETYSWKSDNQQAEPPSFQDLQQPQQTFSSQLEAYTDINTSSNDILEDWDDSFEETTSDKKKKWLLSAGFIIVIACVWRFVYFVAETRQSLLISLGITLLLLAGMLLVWRKTHAASLDAEFDMDQYEPDLRMFPELANIYDEQNKSTTGSKPSPEDHYEESKPHSKASLHVVAANSMFPIVEPTVQLAREQQKETSGELTEWLQRSWEGQATRLELVEGCFKIGRMGEQVSYADIASGVSRLHLEIERLKGEFKAKDLGSRNGSLLNGQAMIPYKSYKLSLGDVIQLAGEKGPSYELKSV
ncbi:DUF6382 domain-containing protein [Paenibacillus sp. PL91]|uniref:DUF6382 domain-containing protein n=1 Tax=Paenibacillus sp. PL91 TaxID=2729538 RepID=UPI00145EEA34|nr:FHA domain-containing protein [Paenibacillus sp. PL91]MBC9202312.1 FHA domain-containing protein [Paenibacillus sp. PL91]